MTHLGLALIAAIAFSATLCSFVVLQWIKITSLLQRNEELEKQRDALQEAKLARDKADYDAKVAAIFK